LRSWRLTFLPVPGTVDQERAAQIVPEWAQWYYGTTDLDFLSIDFQTDPTRFWLIELMAEGVRVYAAVLPDGKVVEPVCPEQLQSSQLRPSSGQQPFMRHGTGV
jgi:hypothetical protein